MQTPATTSMSTLPSRAATIIEPCESPPRNETMKSRASRIAGLDGLRAVAALIVFIAHHSISIFHAPWLERVFGAMFGLVLFFTLSGFLISNLLWQEFTRHGTISIRDFYIRRFLRLTPALWVYVATFAAYYYLVDGWVNAGDFISAVTYTSNYYQIWAQSSVYYMPVWSLAIEEHFYLAFPVLMLLTLRHRSIKALTIWVIGLIVLSLIWRAVVVSLWHPDWKYIYWRTDTRLDAIMFGVLLTCIGAGITRIKAAIESHWAFWASIALLCLCAVDRNDFFRETLRYTLQSLAVTVIMGHIVWSGAFTARFSRYTLDSRPLVYIGAISYPLYLWHLTVLKAVEHTFGMTPLRAIACGALSVGLAAASYHFVEMPFLGLRHRFGSRSVDKPERSAVLTDSPSRA